MTNATKAVVVALVNACVALVIAFGVALTDAQQFAIALTANTALTAWVALTYKNSPKRIPDVA